MILKFKNCLKKIKSGEVSLSTGDEVVHLNEEDIARLDKALSDHYGKRQTKKKPTK